MATFKLKDIILLESKFSRTEIVSFAEANFNSDLDIDIEHSISGNLLLINVILKFTGGLNENPVPEIVSEIKMSGVFEVTEDDSNLSVENFSKINAPAIIFPFIREHLASLSSKACIPTILLPPINFVKLSQEKK